MYIPFIRSSKKVAFNWQSCSCSVGIIANTIPNVWRLIYNNEPHVVVVVVVSMGEGRASLFTNSSLLFTYITVINESNSI